MTRSLVLALTVATVAQAAFAQQSATQPSGALSNKTPGVAVGTTGTTYGAPGAEQKPSTPGGTVPMGAGTQETTNQPAGVHNYNNSFGLPGPTQRR